MADYADNLEGFLGISMRDALVHRAYLFALRQPDPSGMTVSDEDARAMVVAYIHSQHAKVVLELPPEPKSDEDWRG